MNERFEELKRRAVAEADTGHIDFDNLSHTDIQILGDIAVEKKFAELIVRECMDIAYEYDAPKMSGPGMIIAGRIEQHFGVGMSVEDKKQLIRDLLGVSNDTKS
jgi:hypothetical protein